jgi:hypothetical protein
MLRRQAELEAKSLAEMHDRIDADCDRQRAVKQFWKERGAFFTFGVVPLHFVHQLCSGIGFALGLQQHYMRLLRWRSRTKIPVPLRPVGGSRFPPASTTDCPGSENCVTEVLI